MMGVIKRWQARWRIMSLVAGALVAGVLASSGAPAEAPLLVSAGGVGVLSAAGAGDASVSAYVLELDFKAITGGAVTNGMQVRIEPVPGLFFTATVSRVSMDVNAVMGLTADVAGYPFGSFFLSVAENVALGELTLPSQQRRYTIRYLDGSKTHVARDVADQDLDHLMPGPSIVPPLPVQPKDDGKALTVALTAEAEPLADPLAEVTVDLMIVYTPAAASWASSNAGGIANVINQAMLKAQQALDNSQTFITLRLVHSAQVSYTESGNSGTDLSRLRNTTDGHMDIVHTWRNTYGADVVSFFALVNDTGGLGYSLTEGWLPTGFPTYAFNLNRVQQVHTGYTMIHEIGHNMGAGHHYQQNFQTGPQLEAYSSGWRWSSGGNWYASVMAYAGGQYYDAPSPGAGIDATTVGYFSNPSVSYLGVATGDASLADNARTLRETKALTAAYRAAVTPSGDLNFRATALDDRVMLRWLAPSAFRFDSDAVMIRFSTNSYPDTTSAGTLVYQGTAQSVLHTEGIVSGQAHYYTIWTSHEGEWVVP